MADLERLSSLIEAKQRELNELHTQIGRPVRAPFRGAHVQHSERSEWERRRDDIVEDDAPKPSMASSVAAVGEALSRSRDDRRDDRRRDGEERRRSIGERDERERDRNRGRDERERVSDIKDLLRERSRERERERERDRVRERESEGRQRRRSRGDDDHRQSRGERGERPEREGAGHTEETAQTRRRSSMGVGTRERRMFGMLMGTLQQAQKETEKKDANRAEIESRLEEKLQNDRREAQEAIERDRQARADMELRAREIKAELLRLRIQKHDAEADEARRTRASLLGCFIRTETQPRLYFLPAKSDALVEGLLGRSREAEESELAAWRASRPTIATHEVVDDHADDDHADDHADGQADGHGDTVMDGSEQQQQSGDVIMGGDDDN